MQKLLSRFQRDSHANVAIIFAVCALVIMFLVAFAMETRSLSNQRASLQNMVDSAALSVAAEMAVVAQRNVDPSVLAATFIEPQLAAHQQFSRLPRSIVSEVVTRSNDDGEARNSSNTFDVVTVTISQVPVAKFPQILGYPEIEPIIVTASARQFGATNLCIIGMGGHTAPAIELEDSARLSAPNCDIISNSTHNKSVRVRGSTRITSRAVSTAGNIHGSRNKFHVQSIEEGQPMLDDPMANRIIPYTIGACLGLNSRVRRPITMWTRGYIRPGVYCNGLDIPEGMEVTMRPGVYHIGQQDDPFFHASDMVIRNGADVEAIGVTVRMGGEESTFTIEENVELKMSAPETGDTAGILFEGHRVGPAVEHKILSSDAEYMVGTIYLPKDRLVIDTEGDVSRDSEYTALLVGELKLRGDADVYLNTDYHRTDVPVPIGMGPTSEAGTRLIH